MIEQAIEWLVDFVHHFGYAGIFIMTALESTFVPVPSEVTMVPAGYLVQQGLMDFWAVWLASVTGTLAGSLLNYWIARHYGRRFLLAYGKYMLFGRDKMEKLDRFFARHGEISIFTARLIPGVRHVISFPAGLAHMDVKKFSLYTTLGGAIWMTTLMIVGYIIGDNKALVKHYMPYIISVFLFAVVVLVSWYIYRHRRNTKGALHGIVG
jgi:membrane protein DedA with SNARE-associated domain